MIHFVRRNFSEKCQYKQKGIDVVFLITDLQLFHRPFLKQFRKIFILYEFCIFSDLLISKNPGFNRNDSIVNKLIATTPDIYTDMESRHDVHVCIFYLEVSNNYLRQSWACRTSLQIETDQCSLYLIRTHKELY